MYHIIYSISLFWFKTECKFVQTAKMAKGMRWTNCIYIKIRKILHSNLANIHPQKNWCYCYTPKNWPLKVDTQTREPICPHFYSSTLTTRHLLTDCLGLRHMYRLHFHSSSPSLMLLIGEKPHYELFNFLKDANFYHEI